VKTILHTKAQPEGIKKEKKKHTAYIYI